MISWQEIVVRLLFAFILGSATAIDKKWYQTKQFIQSTTLMAMGAGMFSLLISLTIEAKFSSNLIIAISIICIGVSFQKQAYVQSVSIDTVMRLWFAGAVGSMVGFGFFVPAYVGILLAILTNLLFPGSEKRFTADVEPELSEDLESEIESEQTAVIITPQTNSYRCYIECLAVDEAEILALLIQSSKEQELTPTKISSNLAGDRSNSELEIQIDFVSEVSTTTLELQKIVTKLKSNLEIISASWIDTSVSRTDR